MSDLDAMFSGEDTPEPTPTPEQVEAQDAPTPDLETTDEPVAPDADDAAKTAAPEAKAEPEHTVPLSALKEERRRRQELEAQIQARAQQEPESPPDVFESPERVLPYVEEQINQRVMNATLNMSEFQARKEFGAEAVDEALSAFTDAVKEDPSAYKKVMASPSPYHELIAWRERSKFLAEVGSDPAAYRARVRAELEAEMTQAGAKTAAQKAAIAAKTPPSFASEPNMGQRTAPEPDGFSLSDLLGR